MNRRKFLAASALAAAVSLTAGVALADDTVKIPCVCELSGAGAVAGTNFHDGAQWPSTRSTPQAAFSAGRSR